MKTISKIRVECNDANNTATSYSINSKIVKVFETKFKVVKSENAEFPLNVQAWTREGKGKYIYSGEGKFCRNDKEVQEYIYQYAETPTNS